MKNLIIVVLSLILFFACGQKKPESINDDKTQNGSPTTAIKPSQAFNQHTIKGFSIPESVIWDEIRNIWWVSNIGTPTGDKFSAPAAKDGNGFLSQISEDGKVTHFREASYKMDAPKGLCLLNDLLFIADIDKVWVIDASNLDLIKRYDFDKFNVKFLNGIVSDKNQTIFVSDTQTNRIFSIEADEISIYAQGKKLGSPNGLFYSAEVLYSIGFASGEIMKISKDHIIRPVGLAISGNGDGLYKVGNNIFFVSDWKSGSLYRLSRMGNRKLISNLENAAGFGARDLLNGKLQIYIPTFFGNSIKIFQVNK